MKKRIILYGVSTYKNKGVEAIINSTLNQINLDNYDITIASHDYEYNKTIYNNKIENINHYRKNNLTPEEKKLELEYQNMPFDYNNFELLYQKDVVNKINESDICMSVGGDNYCYDHCSWLYALDNKCRELGKKTILWSASLFEEINNLELINNLKKFDILVIRESLSLNAVTKYIDREKIIYAPDPAFSLEIKKVKLNNWYKNRKYIILNASPLTIKSEDSFNALISLVNHILKNTKYSICLLPHVKAEDCSDMEVLSKLKKKFLKENRVYLEKNEYSCTELKYIISKSKLAVVARTHASIAAYSTYVPTLVLGYSVKSKGIAKDIFDEYSNYVLNSNELNNQNLIEGFDYINNNQDKIKNILKSKIPVMRDEASKIFEKVIKKIEEQNINTICSKEKCTGCGLCTNICPTKAITMEEDNEGFTYPKINIEKCIHCNKCRKNCPVLNKNNNVEYNKEYLAVKNKNKDERIKSTSGGVFSIIAKYILEKKGIVYGCTLINNRAKHIRIDNYNDLEKVRGSKYNQSTIIEIYEKIKEDLNNNKKVLFSGTPCQVAAIKKLFKDNEKLITVSVICHGVINTKILEKHIKSIESETNKKLSEWKFRSKTNNDWKKSNVSYKLDESIKNVEFTNDNLMYLYLKNMILRESCYRCNYKGDNNNSDIIIGDYWGIEVTNPKFYDNLGVSSVIVNSLKGKEIIDKIKLNKSVEITKGYKEDIKKYNPSFYVSSERPLLRNISLMSIDELPFNVITETLKGKIILEEYKKSQQELDNLRLENTNLFNKLNSIYNSKRWKFVDKSVNTLKKIIRKQ